ncbi:hypothetical protein [Actinoplanes subglobosus]|uniref:NfeD-like C-terminal domain-containing protein n=1 Tax=Actinoplanes subglobosus TaxID=1547892 RepID=A0ABV8J6I7_9ACTN
MLTALFGLGVAVITVAVITFSMIVDWFVSRVSKIKDQPSRLAFTIKEELANGRCAIVQGIFEADSGTVLEARRVEGDRVDARVVAAHAGQTVTIWS